MSITATSTIWQRKDCNTWTRLKPNKKIQMAVQSSKTKTSGKGGLGIGDTKDKSK